MPGLILVHLHDPSWSLCEIFRQTKPPLRLYYFKTSAALAILGKQHYFENSALIKRTGTERAYLKTEFDLFSLSCSGPRAYEYQSRSNLNKYIYKHTVYLYWYTGIFKTTPAVNSTFTYWTCCPGFSWDRANFPPSSCSVLDLVPEECW